MRNKRGFLLGEETVKMVVSLLVLGLLALLLFNLYQANFEDEDLGQAEASLENLIRQVNMGNQEVFLYNPPGWELLSFNSNKPALCSAWQECLCICEGDCDKRGICQESTLNVINQIEIPKEISIQNNELS